jgi:ABC-type polysaccharide/polyol phosphate transport system ATPase subunit
VRPGEILVEHAARRFRVYPRESRALKDLVVARGRVRGSDVWALRDVSFGVEPGSAVGLVGRNGSGKTTLLRLLSGIIKPSGGRVAVGGRVGSLLELGAGFHLDLTGRENVYLNGSIHGLRRTAIREKLDEIVAFAGLEEFIDTPVKRYSSGMYARLGFSVAAHVDPDVLIVDEVLSVGDYVFQQKCQEKMNAILAGGATVIFVSHNLHAVTELCDRALLLERGRVVEAGPAEQVAQAYLDRAREGQRDLEGREAYISKVAVRGPGGAALSFEAGCRAWVDVEVTARKDCEKLSVTLFLKDAEQHNVFDTSTQRLGSGVFDLRAGATFLCTFQLDLHLARGTFHLGALVYRYDIQRQYDSWCPAATLFISSDRDVRGAANLYPQVTAFGSQAGASPDPLVAPSARGGP